MIGLLIQLQQALLYHLRSKLSSVFNTLTWIRIFFLGIIWCYTPALCWVLRFSVIKTASVVKAWTLTLKLTRFLLNENLIGRNKGRTVLNCSICFNYREDYQRKKRSSPPLFIYASCDAQYERNNCSSSFLSMLWNKRGRFEDEVRSWSKGSIMMLNLSCANKHWGLKIGKLMKRENARLAWLYFYFTRLGQT